MPKRILERAPWFSCSPAPSRGGCKLGHEPIAIPLIKLLSLNKLFQQVDSCCGVVTFAFELGDDPILTVDLPPAEDKVLLGSGQKIKKRGTVHVMNPPLCGEIPPLHTSPRSTNARE